MPNQRRPDGAWPALRLCSVLALSVVLLLATTTIHAQSYDVCSSGCQYRTIQAAIDAVSPGRTIRVAPGTYNESITLRAGISISGAGQEETTIRGNGSQTVVTANDSLITRSTLMENLTITNGGGQRGGGVVVSSGAAPTLRNVTVRDNSASQWGAGITVQNGGDLLLENATVRNNAAPSGAALTADNSRLTVRNTLISNNVSSGQSQNGAVAIQSSAHATLTDVTIRGTTADNGGGLRASDNSTVIMTGGSIENNRAISVGGGISLTTNASLTMSGVTVSGNSAPTGGGLFIREAQLDIEDCQFTNNNASGTSGGAIYLFRIAGEIRDSLFQNNRATLAGGAIHFDQADNTLLLNSTVTGNTAKDAGGIYVTAGRARIIKNRIDHNSAQEYGGGLAITATATANVRRNVIEHNTAGIDGGGLVFQRSSTGLMDGNSVNFNDAVNVGGGMTIYDRATPTLLDNRFEGNTAEVGGAIQIEENVAPLLDGNEFIANVVDLHGGALTITFNADPTIRNNVIKDNRAQIEGGGIYVQRNSRPTIENNVIIGNWAGSVGGGMVLHQDRSSLVLENYFGDNRANQHGGGLYINDSTATIDGNQFVNNTAQQLGGALVVNSASPSVTNNLIANNRASQAGAGIYMSNSSSQVKSNTISDNGRNANGDGIFLNNGGSPRLMYNVLVGNDYGVRSGGGQPAEMTRNNVHNNRVSNYNGVTAGASDLQVDPQWVNGPLGKYYLAQQAAGQNTTSALVDACFDSAQAAGVNHITTRTDGQPDRNNADMGYHYPQPLPRSIFLPAVRAG